MLVISNTALVLSLRSPCCSQCQFAVALIKNRTPFPDPSSPRWPLDSLSLSLWLPERNRSNRAESKLSLKCVLPLSLLNLPLLAERLPTRGRMSDCAQRGRNVPTDGILGHPAPGSTPCLVLRPGFADLLSKEMCYP